jgi:hypothetical protein
MRRDLMNEIGITSAAEYLGLLDGLDALGSVQEIERLSAVSSVYECAAGIPW